MSVTPQAPDSASSAPPGADPVRWFADEVHVHDAKLKAWLRGAYPAARNDIDDVVQESYLRVWKRHALKPVDSAKAFLFKIASHVALDLIRKSRNAPLDFNGDSSVSRVIDARPGVAETLISEEILQNLAEVIGSLPAPLREVIVLHKLQGIRQHEIAQKLGLSVRTIEARCVRAMTACSHGLSKRGFHGFFE